MKRVKSYVIILSILLIAILIYVYFRLKSRSKSDGFVSGIPKIIWTYWDTEEMPDFVNKCIASWKKYNPSYTINVVHKNTIATYVDIPEVIRTHPNCNDTRSRFADVVRLYLIEKHGGYWIDASCLMFQPFDDWIPNTDIFCFSYNQGKPEFKYPIIENWFFAAAPNHPFIQAWKKEFLHICDYPSVSDYVESRKRLNVDVSTIAQWGDHYVAYLAMHVAAQKLLQVDKYPIHTVTIQETSEKGPWWYIHKNGGDSYKAIQDACEHPEIRKPFLKFHGASRDTLIHHLDKEFSNEKCHWW